MYFGKSWQKQRNINPHRPISCEGFSFWRRPVWLVPQTTFLAGGLGGGN